MVNGLMRELSNHIGGLRINLIFLIYMGAKDIVGGENGKFLLLALALLVVSLIIVFLMNAGLYGPGGDLIESKSTYTQPRQVLEEGIDYSIEVKTNLGNITIDLYEDIAPENVNSLLFLIGERYYEDLTFHKVVRDFVVQTGDGKGDGTGNPGYSVKQENMVPFSDYDVGMGNASQFFIVMLNADKSLINGYFPLVGKVTEGFAVLESMQKVEVNSDYRPLNDVLIQSIQIREE